MRDNTDDYVVVPNVKISNDNICDIIFAKIDGGKTVLCTSNRHKDKILVRPYQGPDLALQGHYEAGVEVEEGHFSFYTAETEAEAFCQGS